LGRECLAMRVALPWMAPVASTLASTAAPAFRFLMRTENFLRSGALAMGNRSCAGALPIARAQSTLLKAARFIGMKARRELSLTTCRIQMAGVLMMLQQQPTAA